MYVTHFHPWLSNVLRLKTCGEKYLKRNEKYFATDLESILLLE
jgi:hypothetical protein